MTQYGRSWYYLLDDELHVIHCFDNCASLKIPKKYGYARQFRLGPADREGALYLDKLMTEQRYKICHACYPREVVLARQDKRKQRPGFGTAPEGYVFPMPRPRGRTKKTIERDLN